MKIQLKLMLLIIAVPLIVLTGCIKNPPVDVKKVSGIAYLDETMRATLTVRALFMR